MQSQAGGPGAALTQDDAPAGVVLAVADGGNSEPVPHKSVQQGEEEEQQQQQQLQQQSPSEGVADIAQAAAQANHIEASSVEHFPSLLDGGSSAVDSKAEDDGAATTGVEETPSLSGGVKKGKSYPEVEPSNNVYLWGIPSQFTDADLSLLVFACGNVVSVRMGPPTNKPHTYAFAQFRKQEEAQRAIELLHSRKLQSRELVVRYAKPPPQNKQHKKKTGGMSQMMYGSYPPMQMSPYDDRKGGATGGGAAHYAAAQYPMDMFSHMAAAAAAAGGYPQAAGSPGSAPQGIGAAPTTQGGSGIGMNGLSAGVPPNGIYQQPPTHQMRSLHIGGGGGGGGAGSKTGVPGTKPLLSLTNIYISGLPKDITESALEIMFGRFGKVVSTKVIMNRHTQMPLGTALVRMDTNQQAEDCISHLNGQYLEGGQIVCRFANEKKRLQ